MWYVIEKIFVQTSKEPNRWSDSKRIMCVNSEHWRIVKYFRKIWINYMENNYFEDFKLENNHAQFYTGLGFVEFFITTDPLYELEF